MIFCPSCGAVNPDVAKVCEQCGSALESVDMITCEGCGAKNPSTYRFCMRCGRLIVRPELTALQKAEEESTKPAVQQPRAVPITALLVAIILLVILVLILFFFLSR